MTPNYSLLFINQDLAACEDRIDACLKAGVKVFWFGRAAEGTTLRARHPGFVRAFLLQTYEPGFSKKAVVADGEGAGEVLPLLEEHCPRFNAAQYRVEHCLADAHIIVQASAGTGKTTVMIDRILFLLHTQPLLRMKQLYMMTFTNDATNQMNRRLQQALMTRFTLTKDMRYFRWMEEQTQMRISTIHSFAYAMLTEFGICEGFSRNLQLRSLQFEKKEVVKRQMNLRLNARQSMRAQTGMSYYRANRLAEQYWNSFTRIGISPEAMEEIDWGESADEDSEAFHQLIMELVGELDADYFEVKRELEAIAVSDIMRDLQRVLAAKELPCTDVDMKYLFIDEFQDSDLSQIAVAVRLVELLGARLFVVGDVKQSIYRFRGATDAAFEILMDRLREIGAKKPETFFLRNNYRTAANIMRRMDEYFEGWGWDHLLKYDGPVFPFCETEGEMRIIPGERKQEWEDWKIIRLAREQLKRHIQKMETAKTPGKPSDRVVMLVRSNRQLSQLRQLLNAQGIPTESSRDGTFYISRAVRDFFALVSSYYYEGVPKHQFAYLLSPYASLEEPIDIQGLEEMDGDPERLRKALAPYLAGTNWEKYRKELRLRPVLAVLRDILETEPVLQRVIAEARKKKLSSGWTYENCDAAVRKVAVQYRANQEKLLEVLQNNLGGGQVSLYDVYHFLQLQIATNREESEPVVETADDYRTILCMTVHKAKGLEFDTVIIPYTGWRFPTWESTGLLIDTEQGQVGWNFKDDANNRSLRNSFYERLQKWNAHAVRLEETRILYVAMTRAISNLYCIVHPTKGENSWSALLEGGGLDYE